MKTGSANPIVNVLPELSHAIIGCAMRVHTALGPGLLESVYEECLCCELRDAGIEHRRQVPVPVTYKNHRLDCLYRMDIVVERRAVVEVKAIEQLLPVHDAQLLTYLRLSGAPLGLTINFNVPHLRLGIRRRILTSRAFSPPRITPV